MKLTNEERFYLLALMDSDNQYIEMTDESRIGNEEFVILKKKLNKVVAMPPIKHPQTDKITTEEAEKLLFDGTKNKQRLRLK